MARQRYDRTFINKTFSPMFVILSEEFCLKEHATPQHLDDFFRIKICDVIWNHHYFIDLPHLPFFIDWTLIPFYIQSSTSPCLLNLPCPWVYYKKYNFVFLAQEMSLRWKNYAETGSLLSKWILFSISFSWSIWNLIMLLKAIQIEVHRFYSDAIWKKGFCE